MSSKCLSHTCAFKVKEYEDADDTRRALTSFPSPWRKEGNDMMSWMQRVTADVLSIFDVDVLPIVVTVDVLLVYWKRMTTMRTTAVTQNRTACPYKESVDD